MLSIRVVSFLLSELTTNSCKIASKFSADSDCTRVVDKRAEAGSEDEAGSIKRVAERAGVLDGVRSG